MLSAAARIYTSGDVVVIVRRTAYYWSEENIILLNGNENTRVDINIGKKYCRSSKIELI